MWIWENKLLTRAKADLRKIFLLKLIKIAKDWKWKKCGNKVCGSSVSVSQFSTGKWAGSWRRSAEDRQHKGDLQVPPTATVKSRLDEYELFSSVKTTNTIYTNRLHLYYALVWNHLALSWTLRQHGIKLHTSMATAAGITCPRSINLRTYVAQTETTIFFREWCAWWH